jgi:hypothetical protein
MQTGRQMKLCGSKNIKNLKNLANLAVNSEIIISTKRCLVYKKKNLTVNVIFGTYTL